MQELFTIENDKLTIRCQNFFQARDNVEVEEIKKETIKEDDYSGRFENRYWNCYIPKNNYFLLIESSLRRLCYFDGKEVIIKASYYCNNDVIFLNKERGNLRFEKEQEAVYWWKNFIEKHKEEFIPLDEFFVF